MQIKMEEKVTWIKFISKFVIIQNYHEHSKCHGFHRRSENNWFREHGENNGFRTIYHLNYFTVSKVNKIFYKQNKKRYNLYIKKTRQQKAMRILPGKFFSSPLLPSPFSSLVLSSLSSFPSPLFHPFPPLSSRPLSISISSCDVTWSCCIVVKYYCCTLLLLFYSLYSMGSKGSRNDPRSGIKGPKSRVWNSRSKVCVL